MVDERGFRGDVTFINGVVSFGRESADESKARDVWTGKIVVRVRPIFVTRRHGADKSRHVKTCSR